MKMSGQFSGNLRNKFIVKRVVRHGLCDRIKKGKALSPIFGAL